MSGQTAGTWSHRPVRPWRIVRGQVETFCDQPPERFAVWSLCQTAQGLRCHHPVADVHIVAGDIAQAEANARLMATAPQMLAALEWARTCIPFPSDCHTAIVDAIEAAAGRSK